MTRILSFTLLSLLANFCSAANDLYLEAGLGASQYDSQLKHSTLNQAQMRPSLKLLIGSRLIDRNQHLWYELMYQFNSETRYGPNQAIGLSSHNLATGIKLSSGDSANGSVFARLGGGMSQLNVDEVGSLKTLQKAHWYAGAGVSWRFNSRQAANLEFLQINTPNIDNGTHQISNNGVLFTFKQNIY